MRSVNFMSLRFFFWELYLLVLPSDRSLIIVVCERKFKFGMTNSKYKESKDYYI